MEFRERLKSLRQEEKLTQKTLGEILDYGCTTISNYESGRNEPSIKDLKKIAKHFNVSLDYLLCINDDKNPFSERDYPESFYQLQSNYTQLNEKNQEFANRFIHFLLLDQNNQALTKSSYKKVAQSPPKYTKSEN